MKFALILFFVLIHSTLTYKVLVFNPAYGASHSNFLGKISDILIDAGHNVTMLIPEYLITKKDFVGSKKVKDVVRIGRDERAGKLFEEEGIEHMGRARVWRMDPEMMSLVTIVGSMNLAIGYQCEYIFQQKDIIDRLRNEHFDLAITESLFACPFALFDHIGIKNVINAESNLFKDAVKYAHGEPAAISYYPGLFSPHDDKMSFVARVKNMITMLFTKYLYGSRYEKELEMIKPYYNGTETWEDLFTGVAFNLINSNQYIDYPSPALPKTVFVGGMQVNTNEAKTKLSDEWNNILNIRKQNVLISFGSNAFSSEMPEEFKKSFLYVFGNMPEITFIWKYEEANATLTSHLPNVKLTTWMPQNDLLADDRLTLFVTHGGLGSTMELAYQGKPALIIPLMADQPRNAHMLKRHGGCLQYHKTMLGDSEQLLKAFKTVLTERKYSENAQRLARILRDQPVSPKDLVLKHCEFAVEHGALNSLNSRGRYLNTFQFYSFDIASSIVMLALLVLVFIYFTLLFIFKLVARIFLSQKTKME